MFAGFLCAMTITFTVNRESKLSSVRAGYRAANLPQQRQIPFPTDPPAFRFALSTFFGGHLPFYSDSSPNRQFVPSGLASRLHEVTPP